MPSQFTKRVQGLPAVSSPLSRFIRVGIGTADEHTLFEEQFARLI